MSFTRKLIVLIFVALLGGGMVAGCSTTSDEKDMAAQQALKDAEAARMAAEEERRQAEAARLAAEQARREAEEARRRAAEESERSERMFKHNQYK